MIRGIWQDLRFGFRALVKNPGFSIAVVVTLALGIGANISILALADAVLVRSFPVSEPDRLVVLYTTSSADSKLLSTSYPDYRDYAGLRDVFAGLLAYARIPVAVNTGGHTERLQAEVVSGNYFDVLGVAMARGRKFLPEEDATPETHPVVIISHGLWRRSFRPREEPTGRTILVDGHRFTIVGVAPEDYRGITLDWGRPPDIWVPMAMVSRVVPGWPPGSHDLRQERDSRWLLVVGRLKSGIRIERARAAARLAGQQLALSHEATNRGLTATLLPSSQARFWPTYRRSIVSFLTLLAVVAGLVLILACSNVASLFLSRAAAREKEMAVRMALGAGRFRLMRQSTAESLLLAGLGLASSLGVAQWSFTLLEKFPGVFRIPMTLDLRVNGRVMIIGLLVASVSVLLGGVLPALHATRSRLASVLQSSAGTAGHLGRSRLRAILVVAQVAVSVVLLVGAGLFGRAVRQAQSVDPGYRVENVLVLSIDFFTMRYRYDDVRGLEFYRRLLERVRELPGVLSATWAGDVPLAVRRLLVGFVKDGQPPAGSEDWIRADANVVGPRYFETLGIRLIRGRDFTDRDDESAPGAVIINETMARHHWTGEDPVGKRIRVQGRKRELYEIVGVASNVRQRTLWEEPSSYIYLPLYQRFFPEMMLHVRVVGDPMAMLSAVRRQVEILDPDLPIYDAGPLSKHNDKALSQQRMAGAFLSASGSLALVLACVGLYGSLSYAVARRTREIGLRMALGAERRRILQLILRDGLFLFSAGLVLGFIGAVLLARQISGFIPGISPFDPVPYAGISGLLAVTALLACWIPARKASRVDPLVALRGE